MLNVLVMSCRVISPCSTSTTPTDQSTRPTPDQHLDGSRSKPVSSAAAFRHCNCNRSNVSLFGEAQHAAGRSASRIEIPPPPTHPPTTTTTTPILLLQLLLLVIRGQRSPHVRVNYGDRTYTVPGCFSSQQAADEALTVLVMVLPLSEWAESAATLQPVRTKSQNTRHEK